MKRSQVQIGENVAILFIFFILLIISIVFYARLTETQIVVKKEEAFAAEAIEIAQRVASLPEAQCSKDNVIEENCYDIHKLKALAEINKKEKNRVHYFNSFGYSNITIEQIFPVPEEQWKASIYTNIIPDYIEKSSIQIPISICDFRFIPKKCFFAVMTVDVFRK